MADYSKYTAIGLKLEAEFVTDTVTNITDSLKEIPDMFGDPNEVDVTPLGAARKQTIAGTEDIEAIDFTHFWDNSLETSIYRLFKAAETSGDEIEFNLTYPDGTKFTWDAVVKTKPGGISSNDDALLFVVKHYVKGEIGITNPAPPQGG